MTRPATLRFPAKWKRVAGAIKANNGKHLSPNRITSDPHVIPHSTGYRMYFTAYDSRHRLGIAQANSSDGLNWTTYKKAASPDPIIDLVLAPEAGRGVIALETAHALKTPDGERRIYYTEDLAPDGATYAIGLSTSFDGITWTRKGTGPIFKPEYVWEKPFDGLGGVLEPSVLYDRAAEKYKMWYAALGIRTTFPPSASAMRNPLTG